jgi:hypothetical protein
VFSLIFTAEFLGWTGAVMAAQKASGGGGNLAAILSQNDAQEVQLLLQQLPFQALYDGGSDYSLLAQNFRFFLLKKPRVRTYPFRVQVRPHMCGLAGEHKRVSCFGSGDPSTPSLHHFSPTVLMFCTRTTAVLR